jgi:hypothetical protein
MTGKYDDRYMWRLQENQVRDLSLIADGILNNGYLMPLFKNQLFSFDLTFFDHHISVKINLDTWTIFNFDG